MKKKWFGVDRFGLLFGVVAVLWLIFLLWLAVNDDRRCPGRPNCSVTSVEH
ncbi:hypothetical protein OHV05_01270 [Kitasatospora sp. NBC_00070]|uniref:hypothetical protein n=1 Tax=Kitasatospora sp. NBC_00070 TaxID=2975962 RepID=UPI0032489EF9